MCLFVVLRDECPRIIGDIFKGWPQHVCCFLLVAIAIVDVRRANVRDAAREAYVHRARI